MQADPHSTIGQSLPPAPQRSGEEPCRRVVDEPADCVGWLKVMVHWLKTEHIFYTFLGDGIIYHLNQNAFNLLVVLKEQKIDVSLGSALDSVRKQITSNAAVTVLIVDNADAFDTYINHNKGKAVKYFDRIPHVKVDSYVTRSQRIAQTLLELVDEARMRYTNILFADAFILKLTHSMLYDYEEIRPSVAIAATPGATVSSAAASSGQQTQ